jgi:hypothetical protein
VKPVEKSFDVPGYAGFRERAGDPALTQNEKSGFPEMLRAGRSEAIFADIGAKLPAFAAPAARLLDIGCGCSDLTRHIFASTAQIGQSLTVIDSPEVLALLPDPPHVTKITGSFPAAGLAPGSFDAVLAYSVAQYVFAEGGLDPFADAAAALLAPGSGCLIGDIPNWTMRKRFLMSAAGAEHHRIHYPGQPMPDLSADRPDGAEIDDGAIIALLARMRRAGFHAFILPQAAGLPMANRREDLLIVRP